MDSHEDIFAIARELPGEERAAYLDETCRDADERARVEELLRQQSDEADAFFAEREDDDRPCMIGVGSGSVIGSYKLLEKIGEGGFGVVFLAEQRHPVRRRVALKIIKEGMDTREVIVRFDAERQALAMMDHPGIAKVFDAGATNTGRPYFVMELVRGVPIARFCNEKKFDLRQRLELFMKVCSAVQHAHQKGVIHRDLKPSNILAGIDCDQPVVKIIDFGMAKATAQRLAEKTLVTCGGQFVGTPDSMSPEQVGGADLDIDTRSDVYSLGALLYELLAGRPPFGREIFGTAGPDEMRRIIREDEPLRPSVRIRRMQCDGLRSVEAERRVRPGRLGRLLRGDLDWIVIKALEKDRDRRYATANALRQDVRRFLGNEPISAAAPGAAYALRKFARRHGGRLAGASAVVLALLLATGVSTWQAVRANRLVGELQAAAPRFLAQAEELLLQQRFEEAIAKVSDAVALRPDKPDYLVKKGHLLQCQLRLEEAAAAYRAALDVAPDHGGAQRNLEKCRSLIAKGLDPDGTWPVEAQENLYEHLRREQRSATEVLLLAKHLGREDEVLRDHWLARLRSLPIGSRALEDRLVITDGRLDLDLSATSLSDLTALSGMPLDSLNLSGCERVRDLTPLHDLSLRRLGLAGTSVENLSPLGNIPTLKVLDLRGTPIATLEPLRHLPLEFLNLGGCEAISDLSPLSRMPLEALRLGDTRVSSLAPLKGMPLKRLDISRVPATDFEPLRQTNLEELVFDHNAVKDLGFLQGLPLRFLDLTGCTLARNYAAISTLEGLEVLVLPSDCYLLEEPERVAIDALQRHPRLRKVTDRTRLATEEFWARWKSLRVAPSPALGADDIPLADVKRLGARVLTDGWKASWSPDGKHIVFGEAHGLSILKLGTEEVRKLVTTGQDPAWSPGQGELIAYVVKNAEEEEIWVVEAEGGIPRKLAEGGLPDWGADEETLFFHSRREKKLMKIQTKEANAQPVEIMDMIYEYPAISADGKLAAFRLGDDILVASLGNSHSRKPGEIVKRFPFGIGRGFLGAWSPDARYITFSGFGPHEIIGLWLADMDTGKLHCLFNGNLTMPEWSPDGKRIALDHRVQDRSTRIWVIESRRALDDLLE